VVGIGDLPLLAEFVPLIRRMNPIFLLAQPVEIDFINKMVEETLEFLKASFMPS
jgi:hypothetical protein